MILMMHVYVTGPLFPGRSRSATTTVYHFRVGKFRLGIPWGEDVCVFAPNPSLLIQLDALGLVHTKPSTFTLMCTCVNVDSFVFEMLLSRRHHDANVSRAGSELVMSFERCFVAL